MESKSTTGEESLPLKDRVVATIDSADTGGVVSALKQRGWEVDLLRNEEDAERLGTNEGGIAGALKKVAAAFGDEMRIIDQIERTLVEGNQVVLVSPNEADSTEVNKVLQDHGALAIWDFGSWTFVKTGSTEEGEEETGD